MSRTQGCRHEALFFLHGALERVLVAAGKVHHLAHLRFSDLVAEDPNDRDTFFVDGQHQFERLRMGHAEKAFQNMNNELHRCEVIIQQQNLVQRRALRLCFGFKQDTGIAPVFAGFVGFCHQLEVDRGHEALSLFGSEWEYNC